MSIYVIFLAAAAIAFAASVVFGVMAFRFYRSQDIPAVRADLSGEMKQVDSKPKEKRGKPKKASRGVPDAPARGAGADLFTSGADDGATQVSKQGTSERLHGDDSGTVASVNTSQAKQAGGQEPSSVPLKIVRQDIRVHSQQRVRMGDDNDEQV